MIYTIILECPAKITHAQFAILKILKEYYRVSTCCVQHAFIASILAHFAGINNKNERYSGSID